MARFFDNYVMSAMQKPVFEALKAEGARGCPTCSPCCSSSAIVTAPRGIVVSTMDRAASTVADITTEVAYRGTLKSVLRQSEG